MDAKMAKVMRFKFTEALGAIPEVDGFAYVGETKEGLAFSDGSDTIVVKVVVKSEGFDLQAALEEKADAVAKAAEKASATKVVGKQTKPKAKKAAPVEAADVDAVIDTLMGN